MLFLFFFSYIILVIFKSVTVYNILFRCFKILYLVNKVADFKGESSTSIFRFLVVNYKRKRLSFVIKIGNLEQLQNVNWKRKKV